MTTTRTPQDVYNDLQQARADVERFRKELDLMKRERNTIALGSTVHWSTRKYKYAPISAYVTEQHTGVVIDVGYGHEDDLNVRTLVVRRHLKSGALAQKRQYIFSWEKIIPPEG